ncbi:epoxyqueuosine reductase QueH [Thermosipho atlanticus]|uniref:Epoxyqueuosine reductase QueH n=1 Tax=Thermosipho atlanticus DSM 15807 TaxID=1123380 RepID=A0A1M5QQB5_9BACT|nr:epoxyqueuosine reductase QueH [Thermosipho atlanticus]SHH16294.1 hypothetical protein SAMN02745199_0082 [Thermosipho atlanticus DSM 15807]
MLLHVCCAPDLVPAYFHLGKIENVYFYNPNIYPKEEYEKRLKEVYKLSYVWGFNIVESEYNPNVFYKLIKGYEHLGENSTRCEKCIFLRLYKTALKAKEIGENEFTTTLTASPRKNLDKINKIGKIVEKETGIKYVESFFRKGKEYQKSLKFIKERKIYRQSYCGCIFSLNEVEKIKQEKLKERKAKLEKIGLSKYELDPEILIITEENFSEIENIFTDFIEIIKPKMLIVKNDIGKKLKLKEGWNKINKYNLKVKFLT